MLATLREEFFMKDDVLSLLISMIMCFLDSPLVVILMCGFSLFCPWTILFTWSIFLVFKAENVSLIFKMSDVLVEVLEAWAYDLPVWTLVDLLLLLSEGFLGRKYLEIVLIFFLDLARRERRGSALLIVIGVDLGESFLELPLGGGEHGVNLEEILDLRLFDFWLVNKASHLDM